MSDFNITKMSMLFKIFYKFPNIIFLIGFFMDLSPPNFSKLGYDTHNKFYHFNLYVCHFSGRHEWIYLYNCVPIVCAWMCAARHTHTQIQLGEAIDLTWITYGSMGWGHGSQELGHLMGSCITEEEPFPQPLLAIYVFSGRRGALCAASWALWASSVLQCKLPHELVSSASTREC